jgi:hypothetical protein
MLCAVAIEALVPGHPQAARFSFSERALLGAGARVSCSSRRALHATAGGNDNPVCAVAGSAGGKLWDEAFFPGFGCGVLGEHADVTGLGQQTPLGWLLAAYEIFSVVLGMVNPAITDSTVAGMPLSQARVASIASTSRQASAALGAAMSGTVLAASHARGIDFTRATQTIWGVMMACGVAVLTLGSASNTAWAQASAERVAQLREDRIGLIGHSWGVPANYAQWGRKKSYFGEAGIRSSESGTRRAVAFWPPIISSRPSNAPRFPISVSSGEKRRDHTILK